MAVSDDDIPAAESHLLYQNPRTGKASQNPVSLGQFVRILLNSQLVSIDTQVLRISADGNYVGAWQAARELLPVLQHVVHPNWYYSTSSGDNQQQSVQGPVSIRELAAADLNGTTRVYTESLGKWSTIMECTGLQMILDILKSDKRSMGTVASSKDQVVKEDSLEQELDAFLSATSDTARKENGDDDEASYESDHGTRYVKDPVTGNWVHEALMAKTEDNTTNNEPTGTKPSKKRKRTQFANRNARCWVYVTGLPNNTNEEEVAQVFGKAGIIALDPETQLPRVKLYRNRADGCIKGDASICFARPESVELAITLLDEAPFRVDSSTQHAIKVERAKFQQRGEVFDESRGRVSNAKRKVAKLAAIQARDWDDGEFNGRLTGGRKGLRIIVLRGLFDPEDENDDEVFSALEKDLRTECEKCGAVEKITIFSQNRQGVVVVKFAQPGSASEAVRVWNGRQWKETRRVHASFWDGVTDFTVRDEEEESRETEKRHEKFGEWLDNQDLPEELRLKTE